MTCWRWCKLPAENHKQYIGNPCRARRCSSCRYPILCRKIDRHELSAAWLASPILRKLDGSLFQRSCNTWQGVEYPVSRFYSAVCIDFSNQLVQHYFRLAVFHLASSRVFVAAAAILQ